MDEGVGEEATEEDEPDEGEDKEKDREGDGIQTKDRLLPERRSRRLRSEVKGKKKEEPGGHYSQNITKSGASFSPEKENWKKELLTDQGPV